MSKYAYHVYAEYLDGARLVEFNGIANRDSMIMSAHDYEALINDIREYSQSLLAIKDPSAKPLIKSLSLVGFTGATS